MEALEEASPGVSFGSYPWFSPEGYGLHLVARSADPVALEKAGADMAKLIRDAGAEPEVVAEGAA